MREFINIIEAGYYRGSRLEPEQSRRASLSFTDNKDVASVYAAHPVTGEYVNGSRVTKAHFDMKKPVDLSQNEQIDLNTAFYEVGVNDPSERLDDVLKLINGLRNMDDKGIPFHYKIANGLDWTELARALRVTAEREDWDRFFNLLDYTVVDAYALADTQTFVRLAKEHGYDGIIHQDVFDAGVPIAQKLLGKTVSNRHLTYRPFGEIRWGIGESLGGIVTEGAGQTVSLLDLYSPSELSDESEQIGVLGLGAMYWDKPMLVKTMTADEATHLKSNDTTIMKAFERASKKQKALVAQKAKNFDPSRIVVIEDDWIVDGTHHVAAAILSKNPIKYVDLTGLDESLHENEGSDIPWSLTDYNKLYVGSTELKYAVGRYEIQIVDLDTPPNDRGQGQARKAMQMLIDKADTHGLSIKLLSYPQDDVTKQGRLNRFYKSLGFVLGRKDPDGGYIMVRPPNKKFNEADENGAR